MRAVKSRDTRPEWIVRRLSHALGYRYRLHLTTLPGKPDLTFSGRRKIVFVHGCFWHGHQCARGAHVPETNSEFWFTKISRNKNRHQIAVASLEAEGWAVLTIWECELKDRDRLAERLRSFLG